MSSLTRTSSGSHLGGYSLGQQKMHQLYLKRLQTNFQESWGKTVTNHVSDLEGFVKIRILGSGAFGVVYLTKHSLSSKFFAMKVLDKEKLMTHNQVAHSYNERKILACLDFPFVVNMKYFFKDNCYLYYLMPYIPGGELFYHLRKVGKFEESKSKFYTSQVILALEYLHALDMIYRDLKPENILIDKRGYIKITDFGFTKILVGRTWTLCGTPEYLAPEIILNRGYGFSADWWSFGILTFEINAGYPPFYSTDPMKVYERIVAGKFRCPQHFSNELSDLTMRTLQTDITKRYGTLRNGVLDFKNHPWYHDVNWDDILNGRVKPPYVPKLSSPGDSSNFDVVEEVTLKASSICLYEMEFEDF